MKTRNILTVAAMMAVTSFVFAQELDEATVVRGAELSRRAAAEYVQGVQSRGVGATLKHFAGNDRESTRKYEKNIVGERSFREIYLRGFERAVKEAKPCAPARRASAAW